MPAEQGLEFQTQEAPRVSFMVFRCSPAREEVPAAPGAAQM